MLSLCVDFGNTLIKLAVFDNNILVHFQAIESIQNSLISELFDRYQIEAVIVSSVTEVPEQITILLKQKSKFFIILDHKTPLPIQNEYTSKETLGKDRLAAVIGAYSLYPGENLFVIDAGTAITYDIINDHAQYLGGNISPGIQMRYKALHQFTSKLPLLDRIEDYILFGNNTQDAIKSGVLQGVVIEMDGTIDLFKKDFPGIKVVLTGGDSEFFDKKLKNTIFVVQNLVLVGLNRVLHYTITK